MLSKGLCSEPDGPTFCLVKQLQGIRVNALSCRMVAVLLFRDSKYLIFTPVNDMYAYLYIPITRSHNAVMCWIRIEKTHCEPWHNFRNAEKLM